jgi:16S rRNA (cytosine1407-C5)-methyltransferase
MSPQDDIVQALERYKAYLTEDEYQALLSESDQIAPSAVRLNLLKAQKTAPKRLSELADKYRWQTESLAFSEDSFQVYDSQTSPSQTLEFLLGQYYIQDAASILPVSLFSKSEKPLLKLDMAASPGGKTTQMIDASLDRDFVIANDSSASRLSALRTVLQTWGATNYAITNYAGERWGDWFPETFDQILLDAPCSMQSLRASSTHPHRPITDDERGRLASRQTALLISAGKALKVGGELVYSTCTLAPEEDEAVLSALLETYPNCFEVDQQFAQKYAIRGLTEFENQSFHPDVIHSLRIWPFVFQTNGFFAVKINKVKSLSSETSPAPFREFRLTGYSHISQNLVNDIQSFFEDVYGINFNAILEAHSLIAMRKEDLIQLIPQAYLENFSTLPYNAVGMPLGKFIKDKLELSPEFVLRFGPQFQKNVWEMPNELIGQWLKGYDIRGIEPANIQLGTVIALRDAEGNNIGPAKASKGRLRNLLPNRHLKI